MSSKRPRKAERGAVLAVGLIILLMATMVTVVAMRGSHMQERMASNMNNKAIAFMAAEVGAATFLEWLKEEVEATREWPDQDRWNSQRGSISGAVAGSDFGRFDFDNVDWNLSGVSLTSVGRSDVEGMVLGEASVQIQIDAPAFGSGGFGPPPAAISCLGGACRVVAGASAINKIDGRDHNVPALTKNPPAPDPDDPEDDPDNPFRGCRGNSCWENPNNSGIIMPSVFLHDRSNSHIGGGNPANNPFCGRNNDTLSSVEVVCGRTISMNSAWDPSNYENYVDPTTNEPVAAPTAEAYFDEGTALHDTLATPTDLRSPEWGSWSEPKITFYDPAYDIANESGEVVLGNPTGNDNNAGVLIVDGVDYIRSGTGLFAGVIVVKNCGTVQLAGNFNVYGGILIDARGCPANYDPFGGSGTPSVRYSSEAITSGGLLFRTVGNIAIQRWYERL
jgi:hypothetical protein